MMLTENNELYKSDLNDISGSPFRLLRCNSIRINLELALSSETELYGVLVLEIQFDLILVL